MGDGGKNIYPEKKFPKDIPTKCNFCHAEKRKELEDLVLKGELTKSHISIQLHMPLESVIEHMEQHIQKVKLAAEDKEEIKANWASDKYDILINNLAILTEKFNTLAQREEISPADVKMLVSLAKEVRGIITDMSSLKGEVTREHHYTINMFYSLQKVVVRDLCGECQKKVLQILEDQEKLPEHELLTR